MNKRYTVVFFFIILIVSFLSLSLYFLESDTNTQKNDIKKSKAELTVLNFSFDSTLSSKYIYFENYNSLNYKDRQDSLLNYDVYLFKQEDMVRNKYKNVINQLLKNKKTILFYAKDLDIKNTLADAKLPFDYYEVKTNAHVKINTYLYGATYSSEFSKYVSTGISGNFEYKEFPYKLESFLLKNYSDFDIDKLNGDSIKEIKSEHYSDLNE